MLAQRHRDMGNKEDIQINPIHASMIYDILQNSLEFYRIHLHKEKLELLLKGSQYTLKVSDTNLGISWNKIQNNFFNLAKSMMSVWDYWN